MKVTSALVLAFVAGVQAQPSVNISALPSGTTPPTFTIPPPPSMTLSSLTLTGPTLTLPTGMSFGPNTTTSTSTSTSATAKSTGAAMALAGSYADTELVMGAMAGFFGVFAFLV
ncbi:hypothetical protein BDR06DRAFT_955130 [Suillus hirtellus]|nr:hypothetical protein BDR06DRAFT_955130 [Suillus hirtellus]